MSATKLNGHLVGRRVRQGSKAVVYIVHNQTASEPHGPAENAFVLVDAENRPMRARYISWINLYDIETAAKREDGWEVLEEPVPFDRTVEWIPYGWGGARLLSVADV